MFGVRVWGRLTILKNFMYFCIRIAFHLHLELLYYSYYQQSLDLVYFLYHSAERQATLF